MTEPIDPKKLDLADEFTADDVCGECPDPDKCAERGGCALEDADFVERNPDD